MGIKVQVGVGGSELHGAQSEEASLAPTRFDIQGARLVNQSNNMEKVGVGEGGGLQE